MVAGLRSEHCSNRPLIDGRVETPIETSNSVCTHSGLTSEVVRVGVVLLD